MCVVCVCMCECVCACVCVCVLAPSTPAHNGKRTESSGAGVSFLGAIKKIREREKRCVRLDVTVVTKGRVELKHFKLYSPIKQTNKPCTVTTANKQIGHQ